MRRLFEVLFTLLLTVVPATSVYAGASCFDACTGPVGQVACGSVGLGCPPGGGQCIQCRDNNDCQPGGTCDSGVCLGLPCGPDAGGVPQDSGQQDSSPMDSSPMDSGPMDSDVCACDVSFQCDPGCEACDPECNCACDLTFQCDPGCACDPECAGDGGPAGDASPARDAALSLDARVTGGGAGAGSADRSGCGCTTSGSSAASPIFELALLVFLVHRRRARAAARIHLRA